MPSKTEKESGSSNSAETDGRKSGPSRWWQWLLLYPTFAIAILTAAPQWFDRLVPLFKETFQSGYVEETELVDFMRKNPECVASPVVWIEATDQTKVDGTICRGTGDVWLRILGANGLAVYKGIDISTLLQTADNQSTGVVSVAHASEPSPLMSRAVTSDRRSETHVAQQFAIVVCQAFSGNRIIRHLRAGNSCFDETIDSRTGVVIAKSEVQCRSSCPSN